MATPIRVLIADDSATSRLALRRMTEKDAELDVVAEVSTGEEAVRAVARLRPDIVLMDVVMQGLDGIAATRELMAQTPTPVLVVSDLAGRGSDLNFSALSAGALEIVRKPSRQELADPRFCARFCRIIRALAGVPVVTRKRWSPDDPRTSAPRALHEEPPARTFRRLCVGASTGGPPALLALLQRLGPVPPWPIFIVQHMTSGYIESMADWLKAVSGVQVTLARPGLTATPGVVYLAPDDAHLVLRGRTMDLVNDTGDAWHCPSVDALFQSVVDAGLAATTLAVLLTGMGSDGAAGLLALRQAGGWTIAQDEGSSVVYGMPRAAAERNAAIEILPLHEIGARLLALGSRAFVRQGG